LKIFANADFLFFKLCIKDICCKKIKNVINTDFALTPMLSYYQGANSQYKGSQHDSQVNASQVNDSQVNDSQVNDSQIKDSLGKDSRRNNSLENDP
jgi:hypothetical protein